MAGFTTAKRVHHKSAIANIAYDQLVCGDDGGFRTLQLTWALAPSTVAPDVFPNAIVFAHSGDLFVNYEDRTVRSNRNSGYAAEGKLRRSFHLADAKVPRDTYRLTPDGTVVSTNDHRVLRRQYA